MATLQTVPHVVQQSKPATVIPFSKPVAQQISQLEICTVVALRQDIRKRQAELDAVEADFKSRLEAGAGCESGLRSATLKESFRKNVSWKDVVIRLADRLKLNGESYCEKVLASTKPSRTVSLVVE
jgi:hypothetical protein